MTAADRDAVTAARENWRGGVAHSWPQRFCSREHRERYYEIIKTGRKLPHEPAGRCRFCGELALSPLPPLPRKNPGVCERCGATLTPEEDVPEDQICMRCLGELWDEEIGEVGTRALAKRGVVVEPDDYKRVNPAAATDLARTFHDRDPYWQKKIAAELPRHVRVRGTMRRIGYRSDKWEAIRDRYEYTHEHGPGVRLYEACEPGDAGCQAAPRWPSSWACLGELWQCEFEERESGTAVEAAIPKGMWLLASPDGHLLVCLHPRSGFYGAIWGGKMAVRAEGIVG